MRLTFLLPIAVMVLLNSSAFASPPTPAAPELASIHGYVWVDSDCDGIKDPVETGAALLPIVQIINTGSDRVLTPGDKGETHWTDQNGHWKRNQIAVTNIQDGLPNVFAIAVGVGSARALGYKPSPEGKDTILKGSAFASDTFQLTNGEVRDLGSIGVCPLPKVFLPSVRK